MTHSSRLFLAVIPSVLALTSGGSPAGCCGGLPGAGASTAAGPAPAKTSIRVNYTSPGDHWGTLKVGDHTIPLQPNTNRTYQLPAMNGASPPLAGETIPMQLTGEDGVSPPAADAIAKPNEPNAPNTTCSLTGEDSIGSSSSGSPELNADNASGETSAGGGGGEKGVDERADPNGNGDQQGHQDAGGDLHSEPRDGSSGDGGMSTDGGAQFQPPPTNSPDPALANPPMQVVPARLDFTQHLGNASNGNRPAGYVIPANSPTFDPVKFSSYRLRGNPTGVQVYYQSGVAFAQKITTAEGVTIMEEDSVAQTMTFSTWQESQLDNLGEPPSGYPGEHPSHRKIIASLSLSGPEAPADAATKFHSGYQITVQEKGSTVSIRHIFSNASPTSNPTEAPGAPLGTQYRFIRDVFPESATKVEETWSSVLQTGGERLVTSEVVRFNSTGPTDRAKKLTRYKLFSWGEEVIQQIVDPDGANQVTNYTYWTGLAANDPNNGRLKLVTYPDGSWTASYRTTEPSVVNPSKVDVIEHQFTPWLNQSPPAVSATFANLDSLKTNGRYIKTRRRPDFQSERTEWVKNVIVSHSEPDPNTASWAVMTRDFFGPGATDFFLTVTLKNTAPFHQGLVRASYRLAQGQTDYGDPANIVSYTRYVRSTGVPLAVAPFYEAANSNTLANPYDIVDRLENPHRLPCRMHRTVTDRMTGRTIATAEFLATSLDYGETPHLINDPDTGVPSLDPTTNIQLDRRLHAWTPEGRPSSITYLDGRTETWSYGPGSRVTYKNEQDLTTITERDGFDRIVLEAIQGTSAVTYTGVFGTRSLAATNWVQSTWNYAARAGTATGFITTITTKARTGVFPGGADVAGWVRTRISEIDGAGQTIRTKDETGREEFYLYSTPPRRGTAHHRRHGCHRLRRSRP